MHGLGNDFIIFGAESPCPDLSSEHASKLADRRYGIGCDQLICLYPSTRADSFMQIYNADGSEVSACGNATRCVAWLLAQAHARDAVVIETHAGMLSCTVNSADEVTVDMGEAHMNWQTIPLAQDIDTCAVDLALEGLPAGVAVNIGNPHIVFFVDDIEAVDLQMLGPKIEHHPMFPERVNVSIAQLVNKRYIKAKVWERGAGLTTACGTAACAMVAASVMLRKTESTVTVALPGGELMIAVNSQADSQINSQANPQNLHITMQGSVHYVFKGTVIL